MQQFRRRGACGKRCHATSAAAGVHMAELAGMERAAGREAVARKLNVYWCQPCFAWHVGHRAYAPAMAIGSVA